MIRALTLILAFQLVGEVAARGLGLPLPGPVLGMLALLLGFRLVPRLFDMVRPVAQGLVGHLALLFVPAGVGVIGHIETLGAQVGPILVALLVSTTAAIAAGALVFTWLTPRSAPGKDAPDA
jgi:putative effector of murein hydrolase LrgA (UPF0299 family)